MLATWECYLPHMGALHEILGLQNPIVMQYVHKSFLLQDITYVINFLNKIKINVLRA